MLDLEVKMATEPIVEGWLIHITCWLHLHGYPIIFLLKIYFHWYVVHLGDPYEPVAFQEPIDVIIVH